MVLTDQNAASPYVRFLSPAQPGLINLDRVFADDWRHPGDQLAYWRHKSVKCAEVLVPNRVAPDLIEGAYVASQNAATTLLVAGFDRPVKIDPYLFFLGDQP